MHGKLGESKRFQLSFKPAQPPRMRVRPACLRGAMPGQRVNVLARGAHAWWWWWWCPGPHPRRPSPAPPLVQPLSSRRCLGAVSAQVPRQDDARRAKLESRHATEMEPADSRRDHADSAAYDAHCTLESSVISGETSRLKASEP